MFNIEEFRSYINRTGTSPKNRYAVAIGIPVALNRSAVSVNGSQRSMNSVAEDVWMRAENVSIPGVSLITSQVNRYGVGPIQQFATNAQMSNISMEFIVDKEKLIWMFFYQWMNNIFAFNQIEPNDVNYNYNYYSYRTSYMKDYAVGINVYILNYDDSDEYSTTIQINEAFPVSIEQLDLGWADNNSVMKIRVRFSYRDWNIENTTTTDGALVAPAPAPLIIPARESLSTSIDSMVSDFTNRISGIFS